jgi:hypothetical protein
MKKKELERKTDAVVTDTKDALQMVYNSLNNGQQKKLLKNEAVAALFERYGVLVEE